MGEDINELIEQLQTGTEEERKSAALALGNAASIEAIDPLETALQDPAIGVRYFARKSLFKLKKVLAKEIASQAAAGPTEIVETPEPPEEEVLEAQPYSEVEIPLTLEDDVTAAMRALESDSPEERERALFSIAEESSPEAVEAVKNLLAREENMHVRATAVKILARVGGSQVSQDIVPFLKDEDHRVRANAVEAIEITGDTGVIEDLIPLLKDQDNRVRANTAKALHSFGVDGVLDVLTEMLESPEEWMRVSAAHALGFIENEQVYPLLWKVCEDESQDVQKMALDSLMRISERGAASLFLEEVAEAMNDHESDRHRLALSLYGKVLDVLGAGSEKDSTLASELFDKLAEFLREREAVDQLIDMYSRKLAIRPDKKTYIILGNLHLQKGDLVGARHYFERFVQMEPSNVSIMMKLGEISFFVGDLARAEEDYLKVLDVSPESPAILYKIGEVRFLADKFQDAVSMFQKLLKKETALAPHAHNLLGLCFIKMGHPEMARDEFASIDYATMDISEDQQKEMLYRIAFAFYENGFQKDSLRFFKKIMAIDVNYRDVAWQVEEIKQLMTSPPPDDDTSSGVLGGDDIANLKKYAKGRYTEVKLLGEGGMGRVYGAVDTLLNRPVAVKVLPLPLSREKKVRERFIREAQAAARMSHPNIVQIFDVNPGKFPFFVMEFVQGKSFRQLIKMKKSLAQSALRDLVLQMAEAFQYAHDQGVIHRDIKPDNIMLDFHGKIKIMDFGLAKLTMLSEMTQQGEVMGTVYYMSPEQIKGQAVDHRSDIYSFGVTLYEIMTKSKPFSKGNVMYEHLHTTPKPPSQFNSSITSITEDIVLKCMAKEPEHRYQSFSEFIQEWIMA